MGSNLVTEHLGGKIDDFYKCRLYRSRSNRIIITSTLLFSILLHAVVLSSVVWVCQFHTPEKQIINIELITFMADNSLRKVPVLEAKRRTNPMGLSRASSQNLDQLKGVIGTEAIHVQSVPSVKYPLNVATPDNGTLTYVNAKENNSILKMASPPKAEMQAVTDRSSSASFYAFRDPSVTGVRSPGMVDVMPVAVEKIAPIYPLAAYRDGITGKLAVKFIVGKNGQVYSPTIVSATPRGMFDENVIAAIRQWRFKPAFFADRPVAVWLLLPFEFKMEE
jgi:TonB family protein